MSPFWETALAVAVGIMIAEIATLVCVGILALFTDLLD